MFWSRVKQLARTLTFRVGVWYASIFLIGAVVLLWLVYFSLGAAIDRKDRDALEARLREYVAIYHHRGPVGLEDWAIRINQARVQQMFFVRVIGPDNVVQLRVVPEDWTEDDIRFLDGSGLRKGGDDWVRLGRDADLDLTVSSSTLANGTFFEVARTVESRAKLLAEFRQSLIRILVPVVILGLIGGMIITYRMTQPVRNVIKTASAIIDTGRLDMRVPVRRNRDELRDLGVLFNRMLDANQELVRALRDSLDNVAHDLRTPLSRLRATLEETITSGHSVERLREQVGEALEETEQVRTIINTILEVAQAEAGLMQLQVRDADIALIVRDAVELYTDVAEDKGVNLVFPCNEPTPVCVDPVRMRQVFANLLDNAIKYTPPGGSVAIEVRALPYEVEVQINDTGIGIVESELPRIWQRLFRGDKSRSESGLGLGLNLVKALVEAHGGRVAVTSAPNKGSDFRVYLPVYPIDKLSSYQTAAREPAPAGAA